MNAAESLIDASVYRIHQASNIQLPFNTKNEWGDLKLENVLGFPMLSMQCDMRVRVIEIKSPFETHDNCVICVNTSDNKQVDYMIRLNVLRMMLTNIADDLKVKFTIENPVYDNGNIRGVAFYVYRQAGTTEPVAGLIADYIGSQFDVIYVQEKDDLYTSTVNFYETRQSIRDFIVQRMKPTRKRFGIF